MKYDEKRIRTFKPWAELREDLLDDPNVKAAYDELEEEFRVAHQLIRARIEKKLTQAELAEKVGMKQAAIARLESGQSNPRYKTLAKVAKALDKKITFV